MNSLKRRQRLGTAAVTTVSWAAALLFAFPLVLVVLNSFKTKGEIMVSSLALPESFYLENYKEIITNNSFTSSFVTSICVVVATTSLTVLVAAMSGYALARWQGKLSSLITLVIMSTLFVPFQVYMIALIVIVSSLGLTGNLVGLVLVYIGLGMPVPIFLFRGYVKGMSTEIEEAAMIDGCTKLRMFFSVVLPLTRPMAATVAVLNALWVWGEFLVAFLVYGNHKPMTLPLSQQYFYSTYNNQWNLILTGFVISSLPIIVFYIAMQKHIVKGITAGAVKG